MKWTCETLIDAIIFALVKRINFNNVILLDTIIEECHLAIKLSCVDPFFLKK
jgi:hypothetical protein